MTVPSRAAYDAMPIQVWTARVDGSLDYVNPVVTRYFATAAERIVEDGWKDLCHPLDLADVSERWAHALRTGEPYEVAFRLLSGADRQYRWHASRASAVRDGDGGITHWVGTNCEIDGFKRAEEIGRATLLRIQHERERWHALFDQLPMAIIATAGAEHRIERCNDLARTLTAMADVGGLPLAQAFPSLVAPLGPDALARVYATGEAIEIAGAPVASEADAARSFDLCCRVLRDSGGSVDGLILVASERAPGLRD